MASLTSSLRPLLRTTARANARTFTTTTPRSVARMIITGHLAAEPELQATSTGKDVIRYAVGTAHGPRDNRQTSWFRIASFQGEGPQRDYLMGLQKGTLVYVEGDASLRTYDDAEGKTRSSLNIVQRSIEVLKRPTNQNPDSAQ